MKNTSETPDPVVPLPWSKDPRMSKAYIHGFKNHVKRVSGMSVSGMVCTGPNGESLLWSESGACLSGYEDAKKQTKAK